MSGIVLRCEWNAARTTTATHRSRASLRLATFARRPRRALGHRSGVAVALLVKGHLGVRFPTPAVRAVGQYVLMNDGDLMPRRIEVVDDLASRARRLIHAWVGAAVRRDDLGQPSSEDVGKVESVEDRSKLGLRNPLDRGTCHMPDESPTTALSRYLGGALDVNALAAILEAGAWEASPQVGADALRLVYEFGNGDWTERQLRDHLHRLIEPRPVGFILGRAATGTRFGAKSIGLTIGRALVDLGRTSEPDPRSRSGQRSGIDIGGTTPVQVR